MADVVLMLQVTEQLRSHMHEVIQQHYGVELNDTTNQIITQSWDTAQQKVCMCYKTITVAHCKPVDHHC